MGQGKVFHVGGIELHVENRGLDDNRGPAVRVFGNVDGTSVQLLRFHCFRKNPHYHYAPSGQNDVYPMNKNATLDPINWTIKQLGQHLVEMIRTAGYDSVAAKVDQAPVSAVLPEVESIMCG